MTEEGEIPFAMSGRKPVQKRAQATWNRLLDAAGSLLEEVGVERISTNLVAARAGVSPPTLYHYFPDKYALLAALGERLMVAQNAQVVLDPEQDEAAIAAVLEAHVTLTRATPGGAWIMRMLRAVPQLAPIRIASHRAVARALAGRVLALDPRQDPQSTEARARLCVDLGYAAIELIFDEPDLPEAPALADAARAIRAVIAP